ncbi:MAG: DMT family transporter [Nitrospirota bacterium]|nr:DMT family transporter [Nitrospirota bacterium]
MPHLILVLSALIWGATYPSTKAVLTQLPPFSFMFVRFFLGCLLVVVAVLVLRRRIRWDPATLRMSFIATVFLFLGFALQTEGLVTTTASKSAFITVQYVFLVPLFLRRFGGRTWAAAALSVAGLWLLVDPQGEMTRGDLLTLGCAAAYAGHISCLESFTQKSDPLSLFLWQLAMITAAMFPAMLWERPGADAFALTPLLLSALLVNGVFATGAFAIQVWAQKRLPAPRVALIFSLEPLFAAWLAWLFLGEQLSGRGWVGSMLIVGAVLLGTLGPAASEPRTPLASSHAS